MSDNPFVSSTEQNPFATRHQDRDPATSATYDANSPTATQAMLDGEMQEVSGSVPTIGGPPEMDNVYASRMDRDSLCYRDVSLVFFASGFLLAETSRQCDQNDCTQNMIWGLLCSAIGTAVSGMYLVGLGKAARLRQYHNCTLLTSCFLLCLYTAGAGILTFDGPYTHSGNGFFLSWASFLGSWHAFYSSSEAVHRQFQWHSLDISVIKHRTIAICVLASMVLLTQTSVDCGKHDECGDRIIFGMAVSSFSLVWCVVLGIAHAKCEPFTGQLLAGLLTVIWGTAAVVLTFVGGPYNTPGNGYFGTWSAFIASAALVFLHGGEKNTFQPIPDGPSDQDCLEPNSKEAAPNNSYVIE